ncbi:N-acetyltransferase [Sphaerisporangium aureirubrum]|uniref:N-acetyltransferase n=1 Tax=Sphaerisporangium aureirubrum TaxID=1544736 RepID=A0ABW1NFS1_9ACTN
MHADDAPDDHEFVPAGFRVPEGFAHGEIRLVPLGPEHNERDYRAWMSSVAHIQGTPGFETHDWPQPMTIDENMRDLVRHADDFRRRAGFTYSVLIDTDVIGCVYIYPSGRPGHATVRSWVRQDLAHLDGPLYELVEGWLRRAWPFTGFDYAPRTRPRESAD